MNDLLFDITTQVLDKLEKKYLIEFTYRECNSLFNMPDHSEIQSDIKAALKEIKKELAARGRAYMKAEQDKLA